MFQDLDTYAGTTSRSGQRFANAVAVGNLQFILFSFDVGQAFAKGMAFEGLGALSGQDIKKIEFDVPRVDLDRFKQLPGFKDLDPGTETLAMLTPICGLRGRPQSLAQTVAPSACTMVVLPAARLRA